MTLCKKPVALAAGYHIQIGRGGGGPIQVTGPDYIAYVFVFSVASDVIR
jgi:hypothetical protein